MAAILTPQIKVLARRTISYELAATKPSNPSAPGNFLVCEKMRGPLGKLMGVAGFRLLLARARSLAAPEFPWLRALEIDAQGSFINVTEARASHGDRYIFEGEVSLVAHIIGLLITFIGTPLTTQILQDIWPRLDDLRF